MEAGYAERSEGSRSAIPQIPIRTLAHQICIRRDRIATSAEKNPKHAGERYALASSRAREYVRFVPIVIATLVRLFAQPTGGNMRYSKMNRVMTTLNYFAGCLHRTRAIWPRC